ncbi:Os01g0571900 [Oryza sativa Japonica Group]|uniref:Os01g0571900 protein n=1 Tax=Oryza sativa subsp. japonica TaxID=39947 RepID=A0A0P0V4A1_ORYSJ|nr:Os01g0571900 [Oryza sativa Japonica Group]
MLRRRALAGHPLYLAGSGRPRLDSSPPRQMAAGRWDGCVWTASAAAARWQPASYSAGGFCRWWVSLLLMGSDVRMWKWRDDGLCWREAGMVLDVRDGDFLIVGRVFSLSLVSPLGRTLFWSWGMLWGGRRLRLAVEVCGGWMAFRGWPRARLCRWLQSRYDCF